MTDVVEAGTRLHVVSFVTSGLKLLLQCDG